jgi:hypothetical protein
MEGFEASHYFFLKGICFLYFDIWSILVIENLGECAERGRRVTLHRSSWEYELFFCISKGSNFFKEIESLDCVDAWKVWKAVGDSPQWFSHDFE